MALEASLRPPALIVPAGSLLGAVGDLLKPAGAEREQAALFAADDGDERPVAAAEQGNEGGEQEVVRDPGRVATDQGSGSTLQTLSSPAEKIARPCAPLRSNSASK